MNRSELEARLVALSTPWCDLDLIQGLLGIDLEGDPGLVSALRTWSDRFSGRTDVERSVGGHRQVDRHVLETFLLRNGWASWKLAGVHLGLDGQALKLVVDRLRGAGALPQVDSGVSDQLVRQRETATLYRHFRSLRMKTFSTHSKMCRALHAAINAELGLEISPIVCVTSAILDAEPDLADAFDAITLEPVGARYQVWLDTSKPVSLRPDVCSLKLYAQHESELQSRLVRGSAPGQIDEKLRAA